MAAMGVVQEAGRVNVNLADGIEARRVNVNSADGIETGRVNIDSADGLKMTENSAVIETSVKIGGLGFDSRDRRKSKYLSYPYINTGPRHKGLPAAETEDLKTPCVSHKVEVASVATNHLIGSPSSAKLSSKRFQRNWYRKLSRWSTMSCSPEFINASSYELLSGLHSKAVDCMFPIKGFDLVEGFFCMYRVSEYHDEAQLATSLVNMKDGNTGKPVGNGLFDIKTEKRRKNNKKENAARRKTKSLSCLSDVNISISTGEFLLKECTELNTIGPGRKRKQKMKVEEVTSLHELQNVETTLNGSTAKSSSVPDDSHPASEGKAGPKKRKIEAASDHQSAQIVSAYTNAKCSSLVIDLLRASSPKPGGTSEKGNSGNKEELVQIGFNPRLSVSQYGFVGNFANRSLLVTATSEVGIVSVDKNGQKISKEKAEKEDLNRKLATGIPDLNGTISESTSIRKEFENANGLSPELKSKYENSQTEPKSEQSRSLSAGITPTRTINYNRVEANGEVLGTCLLLQFAPGVPVPSKDDLVTKFCQFGPLKESETQLLKDTGSAQIVFVSGADAREAFRSLEQNKPFGTTLVDCKLCHLSATCPPVDQSLSPTQPICPPADQFMTPICPPVDRFLSLIRPIYPPADRFVTPTQSNQSITVPGEAPPPPLNFMRQNLQMMTAMLENSGNNLSPQMRAKLESEIKNLLKKVNSMSCSSSTDG